VKCSPGGCGKILFEANVELRSKARVFPYVGSWLVKASKAAEERELECELVAEEGLNCLLLSGDANDADRGPSYTDSVITWVGWRIDSDYK
jgi:hypothetical protein